MFKDKKNSIKKRRRISEKTLITLSLLGGSLGIFLGMYLFKHKTKKLKFIITTPLFLLITIIIYIYLKTNI